MELGGPVFVSGNVGIISKTRGKLWRRCPLTVTSPVICTFTPILSCEAVFVSESPVALPLASAGTGSGTPSNCAPRLYGTQGGNKRTRAGADETGSLPAGSTPARSGQAAVRTLHTLASALPRPAGSPERRLACLQSRPPAPSGGPAQQHLEVPEEPVSDRPP